MARKAAEKADDPAVPQEGGTQEVFCPKCEGEGFYFEDGIEDAGGEVFCDCPAGVAAQEENKPTDPICQRCHEAHPGCGECCELCESQCNSSQICLLMKEAEEKKQAELDAESDRRTAICKNWAECQHKDICFTPANEKAGICFIDEPGKLPPPTTIHPFALEN